MTFRRYRVYAATLITCLLAASTLAQTWTKELAKGVTLTQQVTNSGKPLVVNILTIDPKVPGVGVKAIVAGDTVLGKDATKGREIVSKMAKRLNAVAAVNADFFPYTGDMLSLHITGGEIVSEPWPGRVVFGVTPDGCSLFDRLGFVGKVSLADGRSFDVKGVNRSRGKNEIVIYTPRYAPSTGTSGAGVEVVVKCEGAPLRIGSPVTGTVCEIRPQEGDSEIPEGCIVLSGVGIASVPLNQWLTVGTQVTVDIKLNGVTTTGWEKVTEAVGGGPCLIKDGEKCIDAADEGFQASFSTTSHPRTAIGATADGKILLVTVDGRQSISGGMSLDRLAELMRSLSCVNAINLDGGGSTTMATSFGVLNSPSDGSERPVANGLAVFGEPVPAAVPVPDFTIVPPAEPVQVRTAASLCLADACGQPLNDDLSSRAVWSATGGAGFVDQSGRFVGLRERKGSVTVRVGDKTANLPLEVIAASVFAITVALESDPSGDANKSVLEIAVSDQYGKPGKDRKVAIQVTGGAAEPCEVTTDGEGKASVVVAWDSVFEGTAQVAVTSDGLDAVTLERPGTACERAPDSVDTP